MLNFDNDDNYCNNNKFVGVNIVFRVVISGIACGFITAIL